MNRVLKQIDVAPTPRPWSAGARAPDPARDAELARAEAAAYERGVADGAARERSAGLSLAAALQEALVRAAAARREEAEARSVELLRTALDLAERMMGHAPHDDGAALERRLREALAQLDDEPLAISVHPVDAERLGRVAMADQRLELTTDPGLRPGEARIRGRWAEADLTWEAAVAAAWTALP